MIDLIARALDLKPWDYYEVQVLLDGEWHVYFKHWEGFGHSTRGIEHGMAPTQNEGEGRARDAVARHRTQWERYVQRQKEVQRNTRIIHIDGR